MENPVLIKWQGNWADEMEVCGFVVTSKEEADSYKKYLKDREDEFTLYVGSNQNITYNNGKELLEDLTFRNLTTAEFQVFKKHFSGDSTYIYYGDSSFTDVKAL